MEDKKMYICEECGIPCTMLSSVHPDTIDYPCSKLETGWREVGKEEYDNAVEFNNRDF